jgi:hypothetical protein
MTIKQGMLVLAVLGQMFTCATVASAADRAGKVKTITVSTVGRPVMAKTDSQGTIHLLCDSQAGPMYARSTDEGATFTPAIAVVRGGSPAAGLEYNAWDMAVGKGGRVHVAMGTNAWKLKLPRDEWGYFYAHLDPGAPAFSPVQNINKKPSEGFSLAADLQGNVTACWLADKLYANVSHDNGDTFAPDFELNPSYNPCNCCTTSATYARDGRVAVLYREETDNERDMYLVLWDERAGRTTRTRVGRTSWKTDACPMTYYMVSAERGDFAAVWPTRGQIYFARLDAKGAPLGPAEIKTPGRCGMRTGVLTLSGADGTTLVAWKRDNQLGWQLYDADGRPVGPAGSATSPGSGAAGVVAKDGRFLLFR